MKLFTSFIGVTIWAFAIGLPWLLIAQDNQDSQNDPNAQEVPEQTEIEILSDKVYLYSHFNVLFKTPFRLEETVRISPIDEEQTAVLRTERLDYSRYTNEKGQERRAFILGFYTVRPGLHQLPRLRFQNRGNRQSWNSPSIAFASFQIDEGFLPLPVNVELNQLPKKVYLGQNIVLNIWAKQVDAIDQNFLLQTPEFNNFLVQKSPIKANVKRKEILGQNVYQVPLGTWLLNPIQEGLLNIPAIPASVMGLKRETLAQQLEVLPLPPNPYQNNSELVEQSAIAIGQFRLSSHLYAPETQLENQIRQKDAKFKQDESKQKLAEVAPEFAKDELIRITLRITGNGNIHLSSFPAVRSPSNLILLQSSETEQLELNFSKAELSGWREQELSYKAKNSGKYNISVDDFYFFDPELGNWQRIKTEKLSLQVVNLATQSYYTNLEDLNFPDTTVFFFNLMFWIQKYAFYICLFIFFLINIYFLLYFSRQFANTSSAKNYHIHSSPAPKKQEPKHKLPIYISFVILLTVFVSLLHYISVNQKRSIQEETKQYYLKLLQKNIIVSKNVHFPKLTQQLQKLWDMPGNLPNISLFFYQNGMRLQALEVAYLSYFLLPLHPLSRRLVSSLRIEQGLSPNLPDFFVWPLQLNHIWKILVISLFLIIFIGYRKKQKNFEYQNNEFAQDKLLHRHRNYSTILLLLLLSLIIPWRFSLAVNTREDLELATIPTGNNTETADKRDSWNNRLNTGELIKIKGRANDSSYILVLSEKQDQGWIDERRLFLLPKY